MPTGIKIITTLNILVVSIFAANLLYLHKASQGAPLLVFVNLVGVGALVLITLVLLLRVARLLAFARVLAYALLLVLGVQALLTLKYLMTGYGLVTILVDILVIFYVIGMRGYLAGASAGQYFQRPSS